MWPTEGGSTGGRANAWSRRGKHARLTATAGVAGLLLVAGAGAWLSMRGGTPTTPSLYGSAPSPARAVWTWDGTRYTESAAGGPAPSSDRADMAFDRRDGRIVLWDHGCVGMVMGFQGGCPSRANATWTWDGQRWRLAPTKTSPIADGPGAMLFDTRLESIVYASGVGRAWSWTGQDWEPVSMGSGPGSEGGAVAVGYDERGRDVIVVTPVATWVWDGADWAVHQGGISPSARPGAAQLVYDAAHAQLLFTTGDATWTWDGTRWATHAGPTGVSGTFGYAATTVGVTLVAEDTADCDSGSCRTTTWDWNSSAWTQVPVAGGPNLPVGSAGGMPIPMAFDEARSVLVLLASPR